MLGTGPGALRRRAFTVVELVVVLLVLGILGSVAIVGTTSVLERTRVVRAEMNLKNISTAVLAYAAVHDDPDLSREQVIAAIEETLQVEVVAGESAAATWVLGGRDFVPRGPLEFSVAFDNGSGVANDEGGINAVLVTSTGLSAVAHEIDWDNRTEQALPQDPTVPDQPTSEDYLDNNPPAAVPEPSPEPAPTEGPSADPAVVPEPTEDPEAAPGPSEAPTPPAPAPGATGGGWVNHAMSDGWRVEVEAPAYAESGPIVVTVFTPLSNRDLTNERVRVEVSCTGSTSSARPVNSKDHESKKGDVILEREFSCDRGGGFASLEIAPQGRLEMATGTYYAYGNPAYPY